MAKISADDLVFYTDGDKGIYSGGYSIDSILMKSGMSPIMSIQGGGNEGEGGSIGGGGGPFSLFSDLVVPNWALAAQPMRTVGGSVTTKVTAVFNEIDTNTSDGDTLYEKLVALASDTPQRQMKPKASDSVASVSASAVTPTIEKKVARRIHKHTTHKRGRVAAAVKTRKRSPSHSHSRSRPSSSSSS